MPENEMSPGQILLVIVAVFLAMIRLGSACEGSSNGLSADQRRQIAEQGARILEGFPDRVDDAEARTWMPAPFEVPADAELLGAYRSRAGKEEVAGGGDLLKAALPRRPGASQHFVALTYEVADDADSVADALRWVAVSAGYAVTEGVEDDMGDATGDGSDPGGEVVREEEGQIRFNAENADHTVYVRVDETRPTAVYLVFLG